MRNKREAGTGWLPIMRLVSIFTLLSLVPLALLTYLTIHLAEGVVVSEVNARVRATSSVTAVLIQEQMQGLAELTASYAQRPFLLAALADGDPKHFDNDVIEQQLGELRRARPGIGGVFFTDTQCRLTQVSPATPSIVGLDFSYRDWCKGVHTTGQPYVSSAYKTAITGHPLVVATSVFARANRGPDAGKPLGILAAVYTLDAIKGFAKEVADAQGIDLTITDQVGTVLVGASRNVDAEGLSSGAQDARIREALAGRSGVMRSTTANGDALSAFAPVRGIGWTVAAEVPTEKAFEGVRRLRSTVLTVAGLLGLVLLAGITMLARTLASRRKTESALVERDAHARATLEAAADGFLSMDAAGRLTAWNSQAEEIFGWPEAEVIGRSLADTIIPAHGREQQKLRAERFLEGSESPLLNQRIEIIALHRDGHEFAAEVSVWPVGSKDSWRLNSFVRDITERKRAQDELAIARDEALESSRLKSEFLANMSHEIRTPMNGVLGMTSILLDTDLNAEQRGFAETVRGSGEALLGILNDILDFSKIEAGHLGLEFIDFDLRALVEDVAGLLSLAAHQKGLELICSLPADMPAAFRGDPGRLRQVITNLVSNAVKFTETGEVLLQVTLKGDEAAPIFRFEVIDTGIGIADKNLETIFNSFTQADAATTRRFGGTGLGLAISSQLVHLMGGDIGVHSELGHGSTFWCTLPLRKGKSFAVAGDHRDLTGLRVLVVDDNSTNRAVLTRFLHSWHIRSSSAEGAAQAHRAMTDAVAQDDPFDGALLDLNMPEVDGIELARSILADSAIPPIKLVLLTSSGRAGEASKAREAGIDAYLNKPIRQSELFDCLCMVMERCGSDGADETLDGSEPAAAATKEGAGHILVAEDNAVNQKVATAMLGNLGFTVDIVNNGREAVEAANRTTYQAILMDCQMPVLDGYQATSEIRRLEGQAPRTPIIAVTASAMKSDQERCHTAGMDDYLTKPLGLKPLADVLGRWVSRGAGQDDVTPIAPAAERSDQPAGPSTSPVLDAVIIGRLERLGEAAGEDLMGQLAEMFLADADNRLATLQAALSANDAAEVGRSAHTLSGASANLGATDLARLCATLATDGAAGDLAGGGVLLEAVEVELARVRVALASASRHS